MKYLTAILSESFTDDKIAVIFMLSPYRQFVRSGLLSGVEVKFLFFNFFILEISILLNDFRCGSDVI